MSATLCRCIALALSCLPAIAPGLAADTPTHRFNVRDFGAKGDGVTDDTAAINAAFAAAAKMVISEQPAPGEVYVSSLPEVYFPSGKYRLSAPINPTAHMVGEGNAVLYQPDRAVDIISSTFIWRWRISGFTFLGGRNQISIGNPNIDTGRIVIDKCVFQNSAGVAINIGDQSFSTQLTITDCVFYGCDQVLVTYCDMTKMGDSWITTPATMKNKAAIVEAHGWLLLDHICGVPLVTPENDQRWIDNYGGVTCRNVRFGGEGGGFTAVVNKVRYEHTYPVIPSYLIFEACNVYCWGNPKRRSMIYCEEIPNQITVRDCTGFPDLPAIAISDKINLDTYFDDAETRGEDCLRYLFDPDQVEFRNRELPEQMRPYQVGEVLGEAAPQKGIWHRGAFVRNRSPEGHWTPQGFVKSTTRAEDEPYGWQCVEPGKPGKWRPVYFATTLPPAK
jgi:hypothetical protein